MSDLKVVTDLLAVGHPLDLGRGIQVERLAAGKAECAGDAGVCQG